ncbi:MAG: hypothetical protein J7J34_00850 [Thermoplasmata archaeon]|nr:hypothetical protein [Thermoplasmata archaeon]
MRLPRIPIRKKHEENYAFDNLYQEIEEVNEEIEETQETEYSEILLSEPDEEKKEKIKGKEYVLPEFYLSHNEKKSLEDDAFGDSDEELKEKSWEKTAKESLHEIERIIDEGLIEKEEEEEEIFEEGKEEKHGESIEPGEQIYGKIINREVVYETPGGYVVKVISKEGGRVKTSYYSVSKVEGIEQALDDLKKYKPIIEESEIPMLAENKAEKVEDSKDKKSFFDGILGKK